MKKYTLNKKLTIGIIILFIGMGFAPGMLQTTATTILSTNEQTVLFHQQFSEPEINQHIDYIDVSVPEAQSFMTAEQKPMIPVFSKTYEFSFGTKIKEVVVEPWQSHDMVLDKHLSPVPEKQSTSDPLQTSKKVLDTNLYSSDEFYPSSWYTYNLGTGVNKKNDHVLFLSLDIYPIRYLPAEQRISYIDEVDISITYEQTPQQMFSGDEYDLVIIAPEEFSDNLQPLIEHKNQYGMSTYFITLSEIYAGYNGRDNPEKIKYFIKYALDEWNIHYVLLVGDVQKTPIRHTYAARWEPDLLSDLYYADIYDSSYEFCSWDANGNNRFGEVNYDGYDIDGVDLYADVHLGRIACTDQTELDIVVNKIITYEKETYGSPWFKKIILAGGDTFPVFYQHADPDVFEGEITNAHVAQTLPDFESTLLWSSKHTLNAFTFNRAITKGAGFVSYAGHGFEHGWGTYRPNAKVDTMILYYMPFVKLLKNNEKLPIVFFDACLTAKLDFNISDLDEYYPGWIQLLVRLTRLDYDISRFYPCFAWSFIKEEGGGAIATIGSTRTAYTWVNEQGVFGGAGFLDVSFFDAYEQGITAG